MTAVFSAAWRADGAPSHPLHSADRAWPETNCYLDLWIELLHGLGRDPLPLLGLAVALDWEADHFTFLKPSSTAILAATGVTLHELALWDDLAVHIEAQLASGAVPLLEVDAFYLPDTRSNAYQHVHTKTTIGITAIDSAHEWIGYFHNAGHYSLCGSDYRGIFRRAGDGSTLFPYAELARVAEVAPTAAVARGIAWGWFDGYARSRRPGNPIVQFAGALPGLLERVGRDPARINALCFNTTRQLGSSFGLLADHMAALGADGAGARGIAADAKTLQFQIARAARRGRTDPAITATLDDIATAWERCQTMIAAGPAASVAPMTGGRDQAAA